MDGVTDVVYPQLGRDHPFLRYLTSLTVADHDGHCHDAHLASRNKYQATLLPAPDRGALPTHRDMWMAPNTTHIHLKHKPCFEQKVKWCTTQKYDNEQALRELEGSILPSCSAALNIKHCRWQPAHRLRGLGRDIPIAPVTMAAATPALLLLMDQQTATVSVIYIPTTCCLLYKRYSSNDGQCHTRVQTCSQVVKACLPITLLSCKRM